ncbi:MAG: helix-turn-helix domain-containing protein [Gammaproteobacteria bacterium]|nr:helix-turn-helix domain-containing protein [Gammaproteobacteria bacterium]
MNKQLLVHQFQQRVTRRIDSENISRAQLARLIGVERSAVTQLLHPESTRMPRSDTLAAVAAALSVSTDWLLGIEATPQKGADILVAPQSLVEENPIHPEEHLELWHQESLGEKIRYFPATLPDICKIEAVVDYENDNLPEPTPRRGRFHIFQSKRHDIEESLEGLDMEICLPKHHLYDLADGSGLWRELPLEVRREQLAAIAGFIDQTYPRVRIYLVDMRESMGAPYTLFGQRRVAIYLGRAYFVFTTERHIRQMHRHFDTMIRRATHQPTDIIELIESL